MLYIDNTTDAQAVWVPKNYGTQGVPSDLLFTLRSTLDLTRPVAAQVLNLDVSPTYYNIAFALPSGVADGEYRYELTGGGQLLSVGLLYIGALPRGAAPGRVKQYNEPVTYKQFNG